VQAAHEGIRSYVDEVRAVQATLDPGGGSCAERLSRFEALRQRLQGDDDPIQQHMARLMESFQPGLFVGGDAADLPQDNLDLERWFKQAKSHERRIHGHRHAGVRIVQEGPTLVLALDAHLAHPQPFTAADLRPYKDVPAPRCQREAIHRGRSCAKRVPRRNAPSCWQNLNAGT
jgi:hypothetical protein